jgi:hypothetical protein
MIKIQIESGKSQRHLRNEDKYLMGVAKEQYNMTNWTGARN